MSEPMVNGAMQLTDYFIANPILFVLLGLGYACIFLHHFKIHWRIQTRIQHSKTLKSLTDDEIIEDYERHLRVQEKMKVDHPDYDYFRKGEWADKIRQEFFKRQLVLTLRDGSESR